MRSARRRKFDIVMVRHCVVKSSLLVLCLGENLLVQTRRRGVRSARHESQKTSIWRSYLLFFGPIGRCEVPERQATRHAGALLNVTPFCLWRGVAAGARRDVRAEKLSIWRRSLLFIILFIIHYSYSL